MTMFTALFMLAVAALYVDGGRKLWDLAMLHNPEFGVAVDERGGKVPGWYYIGFLLVWPAIQLVSYCLVLKDRITDRRR
jgi:hypothetical protein